MLLAIYLYTDASGKHFLAGMVANQVPAAILGWIGGWVGFPGWSLRKLTVVAVALAIFVAALTPVYSALLGPQRFAIVWGAPKTMLQAALFHLYDVFTACIPCLFFANLAYRGRRELARSRSKSLPK